jgi:hypothetical protein
MYKMLYIDGDKPQDFVSSWGVISSFTLHDNGWLCALGWESELEARGISFEIVEVPVIDEAYEP